MLSKNTNHLQNYNQWTIEMMLNEIYVEEQFDLHYWLVAILGKYGELCKAVKKLEYYTPKSEEEQFQRIITLEEEISDMFVYFLVFEKVFSLKIFFPYQKYTLTRILHSLPSEFGLYYHIRRDIPRNCGLVTQMYNILEPFIGLIRGYTDESGRHYSDIYLGPETEYLWENTNIIVQVFFTCALILNQLASTFSIKLQQSVVVKIIKLQERFPKKE